MFFSSKVKNFIPRYRDRQRSTKISVEGTIFAFGFSKKYDLLLLSIEGRVLDRCRAIDRLVSVNAPLWYPPCTAQQSNNVTKIGNYKDDVSSMPL
jgi:hypothetical protein